MIISRSADETHQFGREFASRIHPGEVIALAGELGAGKTQFVKGLARGLEIPGEVTSPTFTLIQEYVGGKFPVFHFDFYRLETSEAALKIGLDEYLFSNAVCVIEWADKFPSLIPAGARWLRFRELEDGSREIDADIKPA